MIFVFIYLYINNLYLMNCKFITIICFLLFGFSNIVNAQFGFSHEIGVIMGPVAFQSDYGERYNFSTNAGNTGYGIGLIHYLNFSYQAECNCYAPYTYFNDHFKLRSELSYNQTDLEHFGEWVKPDKTSFNADQLRAMRGKTAVTNIGMQLEYFPLSIRDFTARIGSFGPFISLGGQFCYYTTEANSSLGTLGTPLTTFSKYLVPSNGHQYGFSTEDGSVWSIVSSVGTRYKLSPLSDLMVDFRLQYYFSDWVDGLNPNKISSPENKANDWLIWLNVGYIYYLQ